MGGEKLYFVKQHSQKLVRAAEERGVLSKVLEDVQDVLSVFDENKLDVFFSSRFVEEVKKKRVVLLLQRSSSDLINNFLSLILQERRYDCIYSTLLSVMKYLHKKIGDQQDVIVTSVVPITNEQRRRLIAIVENKFVTKVRRIIEKQDSSILGGFIIEANQKIIDGSVRRQLQQIKSNF